MKKVEVFQQKPGIPLHQPLDYSMNYNYELAMCNFNCLCKHLVACATM